MSEEQIEMLDELKALNEKMQSIYVATLQASTMVLPYEYYSDEEKALAGIVKVGAEAEL